MVTVPLQVMVVFDGPAELAVGVQSAAASEPDKARKPTVNATTKNEARPFIVAKRVKPKSPDKPLNA